MGEQADRQMRGLWMRADDQSSFTRHDRRDSILSTQLSEALKPCRRELEFDYAEGRHLRRHDRRWGRERLALFGSLEQGDELRVRWRTCVEGRDADEPGRGELV